MEWPPATGNAGRSANGRAALKYFAHRFGRDFIDRNPQNGERHDRLGAHSVDIGDRIRRGNAAEVVRVVDHRHKKIRRGDYAGAVIELPDRGIVGRFGAN
jgi:hypothetical protein